MTTLDIATPLGVIADTHGQLRPEALAVLADCEVIVHLGDVGSRDEDRAILERLEDHSRVFTVRGNIDTAGWAEALPTHLDLRVNERRLHLVHDIADADTATPGEVILHGHSHKPRNEWCDGRLLFNPGAAGRRRFRLPISVGKLWLDARGIRGAIVHLPI